MPGRARTMLTVAITCGIALGATVTVTGLEAHVTCLQGRELGSADGIASVNWLVVAPPGGLARFSEWTQTTANIGGSKVAYGAGYSGSTNGSIAYLTFLNWTLFSVGSSQTSGRTGPGGCPPWKLVPDLPAAGSALFGVTPPVMPGVGAHVTLPSSLPGYGNSSSIFNGTYAPLPLGNFSWSLSGDDTYMTDSPSLTAAGVNPVLIFPGNTSQEYVALSYSIPPSDMGLGIPVQLLTGATQTLASSVSALHPTGTSWYNVTYIFPVATDQGTWNVFVAAPDSPYSIGGLLFEETALPTAI